MQQYSHMLKFLISCKICTQQFCIFLFPFYFKPAVITRIAIKIVHLIIGEHGSIYIIIGKLYLKFGLCSIFYNILYIHHFAMMSSNFNTTPVAEWPPIFTHIKNNRSYQSMRTIITAYCNKMQYLLTSDLHHPLLLFKSPDHSNALNEFRCAYSNMIQDLNMIQLQNMASEISYAFEKLVQCLETYHRNINMLINKLAQENNINRKRYVYSSKCTECQTIAHKNKIQSMMSIMTITSDFPNRSISALQNQLQNASLVYDASDLQLTAMIQELLQRKQIVLGNKNMPVNNIYEQIMEYLENIPQSTLNFSRDRNQWSIRSNIVQSNISNFSNQIERNFGEMLKAPIKRLIKRVMQHAKNLYCKPTQNQTVSTQTLMLKDEENIKMLIKNNESIKKQLQHLKKVKRQNEKDTMKLFENQQKNQIKISQLSTQNSFLRQRIQNFIKQLQVAKLKLQAVESSKKQLSEHLIKQHTTERSGFLRTIRQLELKIEATSNQLQRLRKQTQNSMTSVCIQTISCQVQCSETQTQQMKNYTSDDKRGSMMQHSRKNGMSKFANIVRKSINENVMSAQDSINENQVNTNITNSDGGQRNKARFSKTRKQRTSYLSKNIDQIEQYVENSNSKKSQDRRRSLKRESIIDKILESQQKHGYIEQENTRQNIKLDQIIELPTSKRSRNTKKYTQSNIQLISSTKSALDLRINGRTSKFKQNKHEDRIINSRQSDFVNQPKGRAQSSRMFLSKPHCAPYIGQQTAISNFAYQTGWLDALQISNLKRQNQLKNQIMRENENSQKIQFFSNLMQKYSKLKQTGLLSKIMQIVSCNQLQQQQLQAQKKQLKINSNKKPVHRQSNNVISLKQQKIIQISPEQNEPTLVTYKSIKSQVIFTKKQVILLFGSLDYAKKYQMKSDIWRNLQNSIMLDNNFMTFCDNIQVFLKGLQKDQGELYNQCILFLNHPISYVQSKTKNIQNQPPKTAQKPRHNRNLTTRVPSQRTSPNHSSKVSQYTQKSAHSLRSIFHKLLRFHKIIHKKCNHVEQFLSIIGFK